MNTCCVVVIGHVDHGKTTLVRALTGIETDNLPEEKARGLSIVPGFGHARYPEGIIDFIDAPGHEDFVQAMVAGASGARAAVLVVSAVEGIAAQTREHLTIARMLGIRKGVVVVTKSDLLNRSDQAAGLSEIRSALSDTIMADQPILLCSAVTGSGMDSVQAELRSLLSDADNMPRPLHCFLPVDRAFSVPGQGTVVTGTLHGADVSLGDALRVVQTDKPTTVRELQSRGVVRSHVQEGERVAVNLRGVSVDDVPKGCVLVAHGSLAASRCMDVELKVEPDVDPPLKHLEEVRVLFGTSSEVAQVRRFGGSRAAPDGVEFAQLRFARPVACFAGQPAVLRRLSPARTIAGAVVLDPTAQPTRGGDTHRLHVLNAAQVGDPHLIAQTICDSQNGIARYADIARVARMPLGRIHSVLEKDFVELEGGLVASISDIDRCKSSITSALQTYHTEHPLRRFAMRDAIRLRSWNAGIWTYAETALAQEGKIRIQGRHIAMSDHDPVAHLSRAQRHRSSQIEEAFLSTEFAPPALADIITSPTDQELAALLLDDQTLITLQNVALNQAITFHTNALRSAVQKLTKAFPPPTQFTTSQARSVLNTSRRIIVPVLEHFDAQGVTIRLDDKRSIKPRE